MTPFRSIRARLIVLVTLAALPALVLLGFSSWNTERMQTDSAYADASRVAGLVAAQHEQILASTFDLIRAMAQTDELRAGDPARCGNYLQRVLRLQTTYIGFARLDPTGQIDCTSQSNGDRIVSADASGLAQGWDEEFLVQPYQSSVPGGAPVTLVTRRIMDASGHVAGFVRAALGLDWLAESFATINLPQGSTVLVVGQADKILMSFPENRTLLGLSLAGTPLGNAIEQREEGAQTASLDGVDRIFGYHPLAGSGAGAALLIGIPKSSALDIAFALQRYNLAAILIALVGVALATWFASNTLVLRWTDRMLAAARTVTAGQQFARVGGPYDRGELGELAQIFDQMLDEVGRRERELQQREEWFRSVVQYSSDMITIVDGEGNFRYISPAVERVLGYTVEQLQDSASSELVHPDERRRYGEIMRYLIGQTNRVAASEHRLRHADGRYIAIESLGVNLIDNPAVHGIVINSRDVTRRRRVEELLRLVTSAVDQAHDGVLITTAPPVDAEPQIVYVNPAMIALTGFDEHELIGMSPGVLDQASGDRKRILDAIRECLRNDQNRRFTLAYRRRDGSELPVELHVTALKDENGGITHFVAFWRDITEQRQAETERERLEATLRQAFKMEAVGTLAGGIAHDFNNVLLPMMMLTQLTINRLPAESRERQDLTRVLQSQKRAKSLVGQILAFSRGSSGEYGDVDLKAACQETLTLLRASLPATVHLVDHLTETPPVHADATQMQQVLMNLCGNAAQAMPSGKGTVTVTLDTIELGADRPSGLRPGLYCRIAVADDGSGIPPDIIERIFDPFFTTKEVGVGTGLGLSVVHGIVAAHKGTITVASEIGKGATFTIYLPAVAADARSRAAE